MSKNYICSTSIYPYDDIIEKYDSIKDWTLIMALDRKSPKDFKLKNGIVLTYEDQEKMDKKLSDLIGENSIQRRGFSFLMAHKLDADYISSQDSDNAPYHNWGEIHINEPIEAMVCETELPAFDPLYATDARKFWHRGFPIQLVKDREYKVTQFPYPKIQFDIEASLWDGDLDVSALQRCIYNTNHTFKSQIVPFTSNKFSPFNSQNTIVSKKALPHYFCLPFTGRCDDHWNSYYVQSLGFKVAYFEPTVYQDRHIHDHTKDMVNEFLDQEHTLNLVNDLYKDPNALFKYIPERSAQAFRQYQENFQ